MTRLAVAILTAAAVVAVLRFRADARRWREWDALDADDSEIVGPDPRTVRWVGLTTGRLYDLSDPEQAFEALLRFDATKNDVRRAQPIH